MGWRFIFRWLLMSVVLLPLWFCSDLPRDNVLDPKNPDSYRTSVPLIEAFVNLAHPSPYNKWAVQSLNALQADYPQQIIVVEYHRDLTVDSLNYDDPFNDDQQQTFFLQLQNKYVQAWPEVPRVLPDVYLNGAQARFSGAYDELSLKKMLEPVITEHIAQKNDYSLEAEIEKQDNLVTVRCLVARLGNQAAENLRLRVLFVKRRVSEQLQLNSVVKMTWPGILIDNIKAGSYVTIDAGSIAPQRADGVVLALVTEDELQVLQAVYASF